MKVRAIRSHFVDGRVVAVGEVYVITDTVTAAGLISTGKAERLIEPEPTPEPIVPEYEPEPLRTDDAHEPPPTFRRPAKRK